MPRRVQSRGLKGSQLWMQDLVNLYPDVLNEALGMKQVDWYSPLELDEYAEYWDDDFLSRCHLVLADRPLNSFWPASGPRWDALGRVSGGAAILVEAKAHVSELQSVCRASADSQLAIERAFDEVAAGWQVPRTSAWLAPYYQYANRLAHAFLLNELNSQPTFLAFLHFVGAPHMAGPDSRDAWEQAIEALHKELGVYERLPPYILDAFIDVSGAVPRAV